MKCFKCGKEIEEAWDESVPKRVYLNPMTPVYCLIEKTNRDGGKSKVAVRTGLSMAEHICPGVKKNG